MLQIGITGGIGAGKSIICRMFSVLGVPVYDADSAAKWIMANDPELVSSIKEAFGDDAYLPSGQLNRAYLAKKVFADGDAVNALNALVHPAVGKHYSAWAKNQHAPYILKEAALLFEAGSYKVLDSTMLVHAPVDVRIARIIRRDPFRTQQEIEGILAKQWPEEQKIGLANHIITNNDKQPVLPQVLELHKLFIDLGKCKE
jgi:dephospho-CoA kinase